MWEKVFTKVDNMKDEILNGVKGEFSNLASSLQTMMASSLQGMNKPYNNTNCERSNALDIQVIIAAPHTAQTAEDSDTNQKNATKQTTEVTTKTGGTKTEHD